MENVLRLVSTLACAIGLVPCALGMSDEDHRMGGIPDMPAHILKTDPGIHGERDAHQSTYGRLGDSANVSQTIEIEVSDPGRFNVDKVRVQRGRTVRLVVRNLSTMRHELVIGDPAQQAEYSKILASMPETLHEHDNVLVLAPGQTRVIIWEFGEAAFVELACHVPGHYEAGMVVRIEMEAK